MNSTKLDLMGLKCPLPVYRTRKALKSLATGDRLEVHCTDPLSVIDIPNLIRETGIVSKSWNVARHGSCSSLIRSMRTRLVGQAKSHAGREKAARVGRPLVI